MSLGVLHCPLRCIFKQTPAVQLTAGGSLRRSVCHGCQQEARGKRKNKTIKDHANPERHGPQRFEERRVLADAAQVTYLLPVQCE